MIATGMRGTLRYVLLALLLTLYLVARAGKLDDFERDATPDQQKPDTEQHHHDDDHHDDHHDDDHHDAHHDHDDDAKADVTMSEAFLKMLALPGMISLNRVTPTLAKSSDTPLRKPGEPLLPFVRVDASIRSVDPTINARDLRVEVGYGPGAFQFDEMRFRQHNGETFSIREMQLLYRMSFFDGFEIDLGGGTMTLIGNEHSDKNVFSVPILIYPPKRHWGLEFRPAWAERVGDYDLSLLALRHYFAIKAGYRWVQSPNYSLSGPYAGLSFRL